MAVANYTEDVDKDPSMDRILMRACTPMIKQFCDVSRSYTTTCTGLKLKTF